MTDGHSFLILGVNLAIIVDKELKKKQIALSCKELFLENSISDITITKIAKTAGIGKGTVYDYFKNKEEIVFEIVNILIEQHDEVKKEQIENAKSVKDKLKTFFDFFYSPKDSELRVLYKEFVSISIVNPQSDMVAFQTNCFSKYLKWLEDIIDEGIKNNELIPQSKKLTKGLFITGDGFFLASNITKDLIDIKSDIDEYLDTLFELIEIKKGE
jgi:AcrR family transcriptional regulator